MKANYLARRLFYRRSARLRPGVRPLRHETVAGSSVTTGNPTEIQVSFTGENGPVALTGRVDVYGATQVPIPGFNPDPLASFDVADKQDFRLASEDCRRPSPTPCGR